MRVTKAEEYGVRMVMRLAAAGRQLTVRELAEAEGLPEPTVAKVVAELRRAGIVDAERGRNGGYCLAVSPDTLTLAGVVGAFDEPLYYRGFCERLTPDGGACVRSATCGLRPVWRGLTAVVGEFLSQITITDLLRGTAPGSAAAAAISGGLPVLGPASG